MKCGRTPENFGIWTKCHAILRNAENQFSGTLPLYPTVPWGPAAPVGSPCCSAADHAEQPAYHICGRCLVACYGSTWGRNGPLLFLLFLEWSRATSVRVHPLICGLLWMWPVAHKEGLYVSG